jgi:virginiamycin B lyase
MSGLPEGQQKRRFAVDCMGCHQMNASLITKDGKPLDREGWVASVNKMLSFSGFKTSFPVMSPGRDAKATADWIVQHWDQNILTREGSPTGRDRESEAVAGVVYTEYDLPIPADFPHDVMVDPEGHVLVTGMFTHRMYRLNPETGDITQHEIPVANANPRALDLDKDGRWWVILGMPKKVAAYDPSTEEWKDFPLEMYPHSCVVDGEGRIWYNGHFTREPELLASLDPGTGEITRYEVPSPRGADESWHPVPYGLRMGPDGTVWGTELAGNRLLKLVPERGEVEVFEMPTPDSGPRRLDVAPDGIVWIPEFAVGKLARFDPKTNEFKEYELPDPNSLPYCVRVNRETGRVWLTEAGADAMGMFDPETERFVEYPMPRRPALMRHFDFDYRTNSIWTTYSMSPGAHPKIVRLQFQ